MADPQQKPKVVLLGGTGFIGSHLICYLNENSLVSSLYYLDNHKPFVSLLQKGKEKGIFRECPRRKRSVERNLRAIKEIEGKIDFVFDCWEGEREGEKEEQERRKRVVEVGLDVGRVCVEIGVKRFSFIFIFILVFGFWFLVFVFDFPFFIYFSFEDMWFSLMEKFTEIQKI